VWGFFEVDCETNTIAGPRTALIEVLQKMAVRFAPGPLESVQWSADDALLEAKGNDANAGQRLEVFVPSANASDLSIDAVGLESVETVPWFGGTLLYGPANGGPWSIRIERP
jgi:hypothetical protein